MLNMMICFFRNRDLIQLAGQWFPIWANIAAGFFYDKAFAYKTVVGVLFLRKTDGCVGVVITGEQRNKAGTVIREASQ